ncbi:AAA family ATPase [Croceivirga radicis]|uniref:AAA family ATPase n=1 Tax=Croceivirga radicis TaxID=1929488 RepID=UPI000255AFF1|nr:AAA family ATPase [Croceivirga radicis]
MTLWKLGCRWGSDTPLFYDFIKENGIVISWIDRRFEKNDWILVANGHTILAFAKVVEEMYSCVSDSKYKQEFDELQIPFEENLLVTKADWIVLKKEDRFKYKLQQGICKVQDTNTQDTFKKTLKKYSMRAQYENLISLLKQKKQIILQGPPGTGKTRLAKELALQLCPGYSNMGRSFNSSDLDLTVEQRAWSNANIADRLKSINSVPSSTGRTKYRIENIKKDRCTVVLESKSSYEIPFKGIRDAYRSKLWLGGQSNGFDPYNAAIAKFLSENFNTSESINANKIPNENSNNEDVVLIQFHPSYTYEDFVRGIVVKSNGTEVEYRTENKILASLAERALTNYNNYVKDDTVYSKEVQLNEYFDQFVDTILDEIEDSTGFFKLTENVGLIGIDSDAFRYKGQNEGWLKNGNRMLFKDIKQAFLDGNKERQDLKKNSNLSGLARQHASYYVRVLKMFYDFLNENNLTFKETDIEKEPLKNFVLIIDEINRANLPNVLGELIYAIEYRGEAVDGMYEVNGANGITIPPNLYIIGTMNTADRSVGHIDYAIRRRFAFVEVLPKVLENSDLEDKIFMTDKFIEVSKLFVANMDENTINNASFEKAEYLSDEFRAEDIWLGHSYFIAENEEDFKFKVEYEIKPILKEYVKDGILNESALEIINRL